MAQPINSFDVFDTLIARRSVEPPRVLAKLELRAGVPGLAAARRAADQRLGSRGQPWSLADIWKEVGHVLGLDTATVDRLLRLEIEIEHEEVIPIVENLARVRDGDVLVSDTYLPVEIVRSLLQKAGLNRAVAIVASNDGKFHGWMWTKLASQLPIREHWGDNPHSDGKTADAAGIRAIIYTGAVRSPIERHLAEQGWEALANLMREVRLANPFAASHPRERHLWLLTCQLNVPLLYLASLHLEHLAHQHDVADLLFMSRDCLLWHRLHQALFPERRLRYFYVSRKCLLKPSRSYCEYFRSTWRPGSIVVDLFSSGISWSQFCARLSTRLRFFAIGRVDNYAYMRDPVQVDDWLDLHVIFRNSEFGTLLNKNVEMLNYAPHAVVEDVAVLPNQSALPILADTLEYGRALPEAAERALGASVEALCHYPDLPRTPGTGASELIKLLVRLICSDPHLPTIYAGHQEADAAYLKRLAG